MKLRDDELGGCGICHVDSTIETAKSREKATRKTVSGFSLWLRENRLTPSAESGQRWRELSPEEKETWQAKAKALSKPAANVDTIPQDDDSDDEVLENAPVAEVPAVATRGVLQRFKDMMGRSKDPAVTEPEAEEVSGGEEGEVEAPSPASPSPGPGLADPVVNFLQTQSVLIVTNSGLGKRVVLSDIKLQPRNRVGFQAIKLQGRDAVCAVCITGSQSLPKLPRRAKAPADLYQESLLRDGVDIESAKAFESLSAKQQGRFQREHEEEESAYQEALERRKAMELELRQSLGQVLLCSAGGALLRLPVSQVEIMKRRQMGRCLMKVQETDHVISAVLMSSVDAEKDELTKPHSEECEGEALVDEGEPGDAEG